MRLRRPVVGDIAGSESPIHTVGAAELHVTRQDVVLIFVTVTGMRGGTFTQETFAKKIYGDDADDAERVAPVRRWGIRSVRSAVAPSA